MILQIYKHLKSYIIFNIISILGTFYNGNIILGFKLSINFLITDLKYQLYIKKKYKKIFYKHKQFLKNNCRISNDWFLTNIPIWSNLFETYKLNKKSLNVLEIGSFEGNSSLFLLRNLKKIKLTCVDTFTGSDEHKNINFNKIYSNFKYNMSKLNTNVKIVNNTSSFFFKKNKQNYDLIYVDGSHSYKDVLQDAFNSFKILKKNGIIIFDDFLWKFYKNKKKNPMYAIKIFLNKHSRDIKILFTYHQLIIIKK